MMMNRDSIPTDGVAGPSHTDLRSSLRLFLAVTGLPQREFATACGVPQATISRFLGGAGLGSAHAARIQSTMSGHASGARTAMADEILWACQHVQKMRDTDVLPRPPEFAKLEQTPFPILAALGALDLGSYTPRTPRSFVAPKLSGGFRTVAQLDPVDTLLYAAAVHRIAPTLEAARAPHDQVFSFRFELRTDGFLWRQHRWQDFVERGKRLAAAYPFVLVADISDFYGQVSIPSVVEALEDAGIPSTEAANLGRLLFAFASRRGRGLPVGPHPSALLAEAVLGRMDQHLQSAGRPFVRFVDDVRIFCSSQRDARTAWHELASFLAERLGLGLNDAKTSIVSATVFAQSEDTALYDDPQELDTHIPEAAPDRTAQGPYVRLSPLFTHKIHKFEESLATKNLRRSRYLLRHAVPESLDSILIRPGVLPSLVPVMRELCLYLLRPRSRGPGADVAHALLLLATDSEWADLPFVKMWVAEVLTTRFNFLGPELDTFLRSSRSDIGLGAAAVLAEARGDREWIRNRDKEWDNLSPWDRRAVLSAVRVLTDHERIRWAQRAEESALGDPLLIVLAHELRTRGSST